MIITVLITVAIAVYLIHIQNQKKIYAKMIKEVNQAIEHNNPVLASKLIHNYKKQYTGMYKSTPELKTKEAKANEMLKSEQARAERVNMLLGECDKIIDNNFTNGVAGLNKLIDKLNKQIKTDSEKTDLARIIALRDNFQAGVTKRKNTYYNNKVKNLFKLASKIRGIKPAFNPEEYKKNLDLFETELLSLKSIRIDDREQADKMEKDFTSCLQRYNKNYREGKIKHYQWQSAKKNLLANTLSFDKYKKTLKSFILLYSDFPETKKYQQILDIIPIYKSIILLHNFYPNEGDSSTIRSLRDEYTKQQCSFWPKLLPDFLLWKQKSLTKSSQVKESISAFQSEFFMDPKHKLWRFKKDGSDLVFDYFTSYQYQVQKNAESIMEAKLSLILPGDDSIKIRLINNRFTTNKHQWTIRKEGKTTQIRKNGKLIARTLWPRVDDKLHLILEGSTPPYAEYYNGLIQEMDKIKNNNLEPFLYNETFKIQNNTKMNPYMKVQLLDSIFENLQKISYANTSVYKKEYDKLEKVFDTDISLYSFNQFNPNLTKDTKYIKGVVNSVKSHRVLVNKALLQKYIAEFSFGRQIQPVGYVKDNKIIRRVIKQKCELWGVIKDDSGEYRFIIIDTDNYKSETDLPENLKTLLPDGSVIFAPTDGRSTEKLIEKIKEYAESLSVKFTKDQLPKIWPEQLD